MLFFFTTKESLSSYRFNTMKNKDSYWHRKLSLKPGYSTSKRLRFRSFFYFFQCEDFDTNARQVRHHPSPKNGKGYYEPAGLGKADAVFLHKTG